MLVIIALFLCFVSLFALAFVPYQGIYVLLVSKPIIDASWSTFIFGPLRTPEMIGAGVPIVLFLRILVFNDRRANSYPLFGIWLFYSFTLMFSVALVLSRGEFSDALDSFLRTISGFAGFIMFLTYVHNREDFRKLLLAFLVAGLYPMIMGVIQAGAEDIWRYQTYTGGLVRNVGLYHDGVTFRQYAFATLTAILLLGAYFYQKRFIMKILLLGYALACLLVLFRVYSKAGFIILAVWALVWTVLQKKFVLLGVIVALMFVVNAATGNQMFDSVRTTFLKEIGASEGTIDTKYILSGRMGVWEHYWDTWKQSGLFVHLFGSGFSPPAHNDYLRVLVSGGIVGLFAYVLLLLVFGFSIGRLLLREINPLHVMALMIYLMWLIDTIGLVPGMYPAYQWYVWGMIGLALRGVEGLSPARAEAPAMSQRLKKRWISLPSV